MERIIINGGKSLKGRIAVSGSKNAVLPLIVASLLSEGKCRIQEAPRLTDVETICDVLGSLGVVINKTENGTLDIDGSKINNCEASHEYVSKLRASNLVMGPLIAKMGKFAISMPGGCAIGTRPIDLHLKGFEAMGARISVSEGMITAETPHLKGTRIYLDFPSVGATENIMMAAALAKGNTIIENAAEEPEIVDLANFINSMGGKVRGAGTRVIKIEGVRHLNPTTHTVIPDRIEAGSFMAAAVITGGEIVVRNVIAGHLQPVISKLSEMGAEIIEENSTVFVRAKKILKPIDIKTLPYPGFPTDMQAQFMALCSLAPGTNIITETVFENRFMHADELRRMGADIKTEGRSAIVEGTTKLKGAKVRATDLRAGAALILAGLAAEGQTEISNVYHIDRGYENIVEKLKTLGADVKRSNQPVKETEPRQNGMPNQAG